MSKLSTKPMKTSDFYKSISSFNETMQGLLSNVFTDSLSTDQSWMIINYIISKELIKKDIKQIIEVSIKDLLKISQDRMEVQVREEMRRLERILLHLVKIEVEEL